MDGNKSAGVSVAVKVRHVASGEVRRFRLDQAAESDLYGALISHIHGLFCAKGVGRVSYVDTDGDTIVMTSSAELLEAIRLYPSLLTIQWSDVEQASFQAKVASPISLASVTSSHPAHEDWSSDSDDSYDDSYDDIDDSDDHVEECDDGPADHFDKKRRRIEQKIAKVRGGSKPEEKKARKIEKLERKLEKVSRKEDTKATKRTEDLHKRLAKIEKATLRNEAKQQQVRSKLTELEGCPQMGKRVDHLRSRLEKLERAHTQLISRRDAVNQRGLQAPAE
jgi:hypothetical protein